MAIRQDKVQIELTKDNQTDMLIIDVLSLLAVAEGEAESIFEEYEAGTLIYSTVTDTQENLAEWDECKKTKRNEKRWDTMREIARKMEKRISTSYGHDLKGCLYDKDADETEFYLGSIELLINRMRKILATVEA
jgi:hypothetical protein